MEDLLQLSKFFIEHAIELNLEPISCDLSLISKIYQPEGEYSSFLELIGKLDNITGGCLLFETKSNGVTKLTWIDLQKLRSFNKIGKGECEPKVDPIYLVTSGEIDLLTRLNTPSSAPYSQLLELLDKPTAQRSLARDKIKLKTVLKPFSQVCRNHSHVNSLTNLSNNWSSVLINNNFMTSIRARVNLEIYECLLKKTHFLPIVTNYTDLLLGDCYYLDTCHRMKSCRHLHYFTLNAFTNEQEKIEQLESQKLAAFASEYSLGDSFLEYQRPVLPPQWIQCDIRKLPFLILGKFAVIISDPAWDIHMSLPYGTCKDGELLSLPMHELQDEGIILLWVTGRSIETGRKALKNWGYEVSDEIIWVKLNQLRRTIVTGRTGHWINHSKEHLLVGVKGDNPIWVNRFLDSNFVVSPTRETLRKPDEIYDIVERIVGKHARKLEMFGRDHNVRPGWFTIGNQLEGESIYEEEVRLKYQEYKSRK